MIDLAEVPGLNIEQLIGGTMLIDAVECCDHGDRQACAWLQQHGQRYLQLVSDSEHAAEMLRRLSPTTVQLELDMS